MVKANMDKPAGVVLAPRNDGQTMNAWIEIGILALAAIFILSRLFAVLGKQVGAEPPVLRDPSAGGSAPVADGEDNAAEVQPVFGLDAPGINAVRQAEPDFDPQEFLQGAKAAHGLIVAAYAAGNRDGLKPFVTDDVFAVFEAGIAQREQTGKAAPEVLRLQRAEIIEGDVEEPFVRVSVAFEAELGDEERLRTSKEIWTFERIARDQDPNWRLSGVAVAS